MANPVSLAGFGMYSDGNSFQADDADAENFLGRVQTYDPNAKIVYNDTNGEYNLQYDYTKLPVNSYGTHGFGGLQDVTPGWWKGNLYDNANQTVDPIYGNITSHYNSDTTTDNSFLARFGPMLPLLMAGGVGALTGTGFAGVGAAGTLARIPQTIGNIADGSFNPASLLGTAGALTGISPGGIFDGLAGSAVSQGAGAMDDSDVWDLIGGGGSNPFTDQFPIPSFLQDGSSPTFGDGGGLGSSLAGGGDYYTIDPVSGMPSMGGGASTATSALGRLLGGSGGSSGLTSLLGGSGSGGIGSLLSSLLPYLAIAGGGAMAYSNQGRAAQQLQDAANSANDMVKGIYGQSQANLQPYQQAGAQAVGQMQNTPYQPMAGQFQTTAPGQMPTMTAPGGMPKMNAPIMNFQASAPAMTLGNLGAGRLKRA